MVMPMLIQQDDQEALVGWMATALTVTSILRKVVVPRVRAAVSCTEASRAALQEAAELLQEAGDADEILHEDVLKAVPPGAEALFGVAAAKLVAGVFDGPRPLTGAIQAAADLVISVLAFPPRVSGPLQDARRDLKLAIHTHADAAYLFYLCAPDLGLPPGHDSREFWDYHHQQATSLALEAEERMNAAIWQSYAAERAHRVCLILSTRPGEAEQILRHAIGEVDAALVAMRSLRSSVVSLELFMRDVIGEAPPSP